MLRNKIIYKIKKNSDDTRRSAKATQTVREALPHIEVIYKELLIFKKIKNEEKRR